MTIQRNLVIYSLCNVLSNTMRLKLRSLKSQSNRIKSQQILRSVVVIVLIVETFLTVKFFFTINTIIFNCKHSLSSYQIALHHDQAQHVVFNQAHLIMMIWVNLGRDKRCVQFCVFG